MVDRSIRAWLDLLDATELLVLAGFQQRLGPEQAPAAYRNWCQEQSQRHFEHLVELAHRLQNAGAGAHPIALSPASGERAG